MSQSIGILDITFQAGADLSASQFAPVKLGANANEVVLAGVNEEAIGIIQNAPTSGKAAQVRLAGTSKVKASGAIAKGLAIVAAAAGQVAAAGGGHTHQENTAGAYTQNAQTLGPTAASIQYVLGRLLEAAGAAGDIVEMFIQPQRW